MTRHTATYLPHAKSHATQAPHSNITSSIYLLNISNSRPQRHWNRSLNTLRQQDNEHAIIAVSGVTHFADDAVVVSSIFIYSPILVHEGSTLVATTGEKIGTSNVVVPVSPIGWIDGRRGSRIWSGSNSSIWRYFRLICSSHTTSINASWWCGWSR